jgi:CheY-like chemotaxis protein
MARQAGGIARIQSSVAKGTTVRLLLQRTSGDETRQAPREHDDSRASAPASILIVDDDRDVRCFLKESLASLGYAVDEAADGRAGLEALARARPDLMIVDFAMPGMTGAEVAQNVRAGHADLPILFASGYVETAAFEDLLDANMAVLRKPFRISELHDAIERLLQRR